MSQKLSKNKKKPASNDDSKKVSNESKNTESNSKKKKPLSGFLHFIREQGVVGLSVGFILGGSVSGLAKSLVNDIISPFLGLLLSKVGDFQDATVMVGEAEVRWGAFTMSFIDFVVIAAVIYFFVKGLKLDKLDEKKSKK